MPKPALSDDNSENPSKRLSSVNSALLVLKAFTAEEPELGISALAKRLGLSKSTVHRLVVTLVAEGFLEQNPQTGRYWLGLALFELGGLVRRRMDVSHEARALLGMLRDRTQETVRLAVLSHASIMYLYNMESVHAVGIRSSYLGALKPAHCTAEGRVLLAYSTPEACKAALEGELLARTPKTLTDPDALQRMLDEVRQAGYALDDEESEIGMRGLAAPIRDMSGRVIAAVGLAGPIQRLNKKRLRALAPDVLSTADAVSARLGYSRR